MVQPRNKVIGNFKHQLSNRIRRQCFRIVVPANQQEGLQTHRIDPVKFPNLIILGQNRVICQPSQIVTVTDCIRNVLVGNPFFTILREKLNPVTGNWGLDPH